MKKKKAHRVLRHTFPMKRPAHGAFNGKGGSSSSSFAKLCSGSFRVGSGISPQKTRTFYPIFRSFHPK